MSKATLNLKFISHGTLESRDIARTRAFYEQFMGFEVVQTSDKSLWFRLGGKHSYTCVETKRKARMSLLGHNGVDVTSDREVNECHRLVTRDAERWGLHHISQPRVQHGTYSFYFWDADDNCWEILSNPSGGYSWMFDRGDQHGVGHMSKDFARPKPADTED